MQFNQTRTTPNRYMAFGPRRSLVGLAFTGSFVACLTGSRVSPACAADWPQFRGPARNGISTEKGWSARWPKQGPKAVWKVNVGKGHSSVAVSGGRVYTMGNSADRDTVFCLDAATGRTVWKQSYRCPAKDYPGPRSTPTVSGGRVYTFSRDAQLYCLNSATGKVVWSRNLIRDHKVNSPTWGFASSPIVEGNLVIVNAGAAGVAVDKTTGKTVWQSGTKMGGYATPVAFSAAGKRCVAVFSSDALAGVEAKSGKQLWSYPWKTDSGVNAADPLVAGDQIFIASGYGKGGALVKVSTGKATAVWQNRSMKSHFSSPLLVKGNLFGNDDGTLRCLDFRTGTVKWSKGGLGKGGLMAADGKLIVLSEHGLLSIVQATAAGYKELAAAQVLGGTCWTAPVLSGGRIYCRNQEGDLVCLNVQG